MQEQSINEVRALKAHVALNVTDVEKSVEFYEKLLQLKPAKQRVGYAKFDVQNPPLNLTLNQVTKVEPGSLSHMGIQVATTDDVLHTKLHWNAAGLETEDEMQTNCCYALQDKTWVSDPDGNRWEVFVVLEDNLAVSNACCTSAPASLQSISRS